MLGLVLLTPMGLHLHVIVTWHQLVGLGTNNKEAKFTERTVVVASPALSW